MYLLQVLRLVLLALLVPAFATADRLIFIPTGGRLRSDLIKVEAINQGLKNDNRLMSVGTGLGHSFDFEVIDSFVRGRGHRTTLDFAYNYVIPIPDLAPGITVGVQDLLNRTTTGRGFYGAITWRYNQDSEVNSDTPLDLTIGAGTGRFKGAFVGARLPLTNEFRILVEHDSQRITAGAEVVPVQNVRLLWLIQKDQTLLGASLRVRF